MNDPFALHRFVEAQKSCYPAVLEELQNGKKQGHWMWFVFPQFAGLGYSPMARLYAIKELEEAVAYLQHPVLGSRLRECSEAVLGIEGKTISEIFGYPDDLKLHSSMTLFTLAAIDATVFSRVIDHCFNGSMDERSRQLILDSPV